MLSRLGCMHSSNWLAWQTSDLKPVFLGGFAPLVDF